MPTFTIDLTAPQATRLSVAFGKFFNLQDGEGLPRAANAHDVENFLKLELKKIVLIQERKDAEAALNPPDF